MLNHNPHAKLIADIVCEFLICLCILHHASQIKGGIADTGEG